MALGYPIGGFHQPGTSVFPGFSLSKTVPLANCPARTTTDFWVPTAQQPQRGVGMGGKRRHFPGAL